MAQRYIVKKGESALTLGKKFGVPPQAILNQNRINSLTAGQTVRIPRKKGQAGYYTTGEGERKIVTINGQQIRMGPNSSISPQQTVTPMQQFMNSLMGTGSLPAASMQAAVAPNSLAGVPVQGLTSQQYGYLQTPATPQTLQTRNAQWGQATGGFAGPDGTDITRRGYIPPTTQVPAFSSAGSQARMNEAYVPPPIQTGYADYGQRVNQGLVTPTNALPTSQPTPLITPSSRAAGQAQFLAGEGINPESGYIPTRGDVWQMKANARRRRMEANAGDVQQQETIAGNAQNTAVNWRV